MTSNAFRLIPISTNDANELRRIGGPVYVADSAPGFPCRQCLNDAALGEELILISHDPFSGTSEYRSASPIFLHRQPCQPFTGEDLPLQLTQRQLSVRSFDVDEMMIDAAVISGSALGDTLSEFFSDHRSERIHIHNAGRGCWAATAVRA